MARTKVIRVFYTRSGPGSMNLPFKNRQNLTRRTQYSYPSGTLIGFVRAGSIRCEFAGGPGPSGACPRLGEVVPLGLFPNDAIRKLSDFAVKPLTWKLQAALV